MPMSGRVRVADMPMFFSRYAFLRLLASRAYSSLFAQQSKSIADNEQAGADIGEYCHPQGAIA